MKSLWQLVRHCDRNRVINNDKVEHDLKINLNNKYAFVIFSKIT